MPETDDQLYDYYYSDDPPSSREGYMDYKMRDVDLAKPPDEMSLKERGAFLYPEENDIGKSDYKIDKVVDYIINIEGKINERMLNKYVIEFMSLNLPFKYIWNYIRKNYIDKGK